MTDLLSPPLKILTGCLKNFKVDFNLTDDTESPPCSGQAYFSSITSETPHVCHRLGPSWYHSDSQSKSCSTFSQILVLLFLWPIMTPLLLSLTLSHLWHLAQASLSLGTHPWWGALRLSEAPLLNAPTAPCAFPSPSSDHCTVTVSPKLNSLRLGFASRMTQSRCWWVKNYCWELKEILHRMCLANTGHSEMLPLPMKAMHYCLEISTWSSS